MGDFDLPPEKNQAFQDLYENYYSYVVALFRRMGFDPEESQDLAQETFLRVFRSMEGFRGESRSGFLAMTARRVGYNVIRDRKAAKRRANVESLDGLRYEPASANKSPYTGERPLSSEDQLLTSEEETLRRRHLAEEIMLLSPTLRPPLELRINGLKYREIAEILDISMDAVKSRIHSAKKVLASRTNGDSSNPATEGEAGENEERPGRERGDEDR